MKLRVNGNTFEIHGNSPQQVAVTTRTMGTDDQSENNSGNNQIQGGEVLRKESSIAKAIMMGSVGILHRETDKINVEQDNDEGGSFDELVEPVTTPMR